MRNIGTPRYLRATLITALAVATLPGGFLFFAFVDSLSPRWDPDGDSGAIQGFISIFLATLMAIGYTMVAFPTVAHRLDRRKKLRLGPFVVVLISWLLVTSFLVAIAMSWQLGALSLAVRLAFVLFATGTVFCLPFAPLWLYLAK